MPNEDSGSRKDIPNNYNLLERVRGRQKFITVLKPYAVSGEQVKLLYKSGSLGFSPATTSSQSTPDHPHHPPTDQWAHPQSTLLTNQNTAYPTPRPSGNMIHGRHKGVSLNFQAKIATANRPKNAPMILGSIVLFPMHIEF